MCSLLGTSGVRNLGVHTEMLTDGIVDLHRAGIVNGSAKNVHPGKIVCTFGVGSRTMYDTVNRNPDFSFQPTDLTNPPHLIRTSPRADADFFVPGDPDVDPRRVAAVRCTLGSR